MKIYGDLGSGNCLKAKYTADFLKRPYEWVPIDIMKGESRTPEFLAMSPQGQVPVLQLDDGRAIAQSNAIIRYLAAGSELLPKDLFVQAKIDELLFWEQYNHEPAVAVCRFHMLYLGRPKEALEPWRVERGNAALDLMEKMLQNRSFFVGDSLTIADISLVAYTRLAHEGGFDLASRPHVRTWIARVEKGLGIAPIKSAAA